MANGFKDLIVWQKGIDLVEATYKLVSSLPSHEQFGLTLQMTRAAISIPSNIAEGYRRTSKSEYKHLCTIALGSAAELETLLIITQRVYPNIEATIASAYCIEVQKMLTVLIAKLR